MKLWKVVLHQTEVALSTITFSISSWGVSQGSLLSTWPCLPVVNVVLLLGFYDIF